MAFVCVYVYVCVLYIYIYIYIYRPWPKKTDHNLKTGYVKTGYDRWLITVITHKYQKNTQKQMFYMVK